MPDEQSIPDPFTISYFLVVVDKEGHPAAPHLVRPILNGQQDDTPERVMLMIGFARGILPEPLWPEDREQVEAIWELLALKNGVRIQAYDVTPRQDVQIAEPQPGDNPGAVGAADGQQAPTTGPWPSPRLH